MSPNFGPGNAVAYEDPAAFGSVRRSAG